MSWEYLNPEWVDQRKEDGIAIFAVVKKLNENTIIRLHESK